MATHWEQFDGGPTRPRNDRPGVSINDRDQITLNRFTVKLLGSPDAVLLMFDKKDSVIGVVPANARNDRAFPLRPKGLTNWVINAAPFCRHFGIKLSHTERFDDPEMDSDGILRLDLRRTHVASIRRPRQTRAQAAKG